MTADVGEMFWFGEMPWHGQGREVSWPLTWEEALSRGGLDWEVRSVPLWAGPGTLLPPTGQPSLFGEPLPPCLARVPGRKALVRADRPQGAPGSVLGVVHDDFVPLQNREGIEAFDEVFGLGGKVYETGGWLGDGERIWLLARAGDPLEPLPGDEVRRYVLFANSHDGSTAIRVRRTGIRVVCQNTFTLALGERAAGPELRLRHAFSLEALRGELQLLRDRWKAEERDLAAGLRLLGARQAPAGALPVLLDRLFPLPKAPALGASRAVLLSFERRLAETEEARGTLAQLVEAGRGTELKNVRGSLWGLFNAVTEYADHHAGERRTGPGWSLLGGGNALKERAWAAIQQLARAA